MFESTDPGRPSSGSSVPVSAAMMPASETPRGLPRRNTRRAVPGSMRGGCRTFERKIASVTQGARLAPRPNASCRFSKDARRFALRLASRRGLSTVCLRPSVVQTQPWASPSIVPGRLLISTSRRPAGVRTSKSTSLTRPSSSTNSKFDHARHGSWSGKCSRRNSRASRSHSYAEGLTTVQRGGFMGFCVPYRWRLAAPVVPSVRASSR